TEPPPVTQTTRKGGWLDEVAFTPVESASAIQQIQAGAIDIYTFGMSSDKVEEIKKSGLKYVTSYSGYYGILLNPAVFKDTTTLNPFSNRKIREAVNWLIDRNYINQEIYGGGSLPKYLPITTQLVDYTNVVETARKLETYYSYNPEKAKEVIAAEMETMGASLNAEGKWEYQGKPVILTFIIRNDGDGTRLPLGDYVANQLETIGFAVDRQYKKSSEAAPIWIQSDPKDGLWHLYTAGWISGGLTRDEKNIFQEMYLPSSVQGLPVFLANQPDPEFQKVGDALAEGNFTTLEERKELFAKALELALKDSLQVWVIDQRQYMPMKENIQVTYDVGSGIEASFMPPYTLRIADQEGGRVKVGTNDLFTDPWNPIGGSNWVWDGFVQKFTQSYGFMLDPFTGLQWPLRAERAEVTVQAGLPVQKNHDWITLNTAETISVPEDAWVDWDAANQKFITAGELIPKIEEAKSQKKAYDAAYNENQPKLEEKALELAKGLNYADFNQDSAKQVLENLAAYLKELVGQEVDLQSLLSSENVMAEIDELVSRVNSTETVLKPEEKVEAVKSFALSKIQIAPFDPVLEALASRDIKTAKVKSVVYYPADLFETVKWHDGSNFSLADVVMAMIMSFDPAKPESAIYDESAVPNFESFLSYFKGVKIVSTDPLVIETYTDNFYSDAELNITSWWPYYSYGEASWAAIAIGNLAEAAGELAYTADKSTQKEVEQTNFVGGPSLEILNKYLDQAIAEQTIPYAPTLGEYLTTEQAVARYNNLKAWFEAHGHFWVGTGPYYLDSVGLTEKTAVVKQNPDFPDLADRWAGFSEPMLAEATLDGPAQVKIGQETTFDLTITLKNGDPYPSAEIKEVKFLIYNDQGETLYVGQGQPGEGDGVFTLTIPADVAATLTAGAGKIEAAVVPIPVAIPAFASLEYVVVP
ncbi:MAG: ABC transporter substrate-binding protein, partial [Anaerolineales bacterium]